MDVASTYVCTCEDNIEVHRNEVEYESVELIQLAQYRVLWQAVLNMVVKLQIALKLKSQRERLFAMYGWDAEQRHF